MFYKYIFKSYDSKKIFVQNSPTYQLLLEMCKNPEKLRITSRLPIFTWVFNLYLIKYNPKRSVRCNIWYFFWITLTKIWNSQWNFINFHKHHWIITPVKSTDAYTSKIIIPSLWKMKHWRNITCTKNFHKPIFFFFFFQTTQSI